MDDNVAAAVVGRSTSAYLAINGSFLYRDKFVQTTQSSRKLLAHLIATGNTVQSDDFWLIDNDTIKGHYKVLTQQKPEEMVSMTYAVAHELGCIGDLLFILLGTVKGLRPQARQINRGMVKELRLDPSHAGPDIQKTGDGIYSLHGILPIEELLEHIKSDLQETGKSLSEEDRRAIGSAYDAMLDEATTEVSVPNEGVQEKSETILGKIASSLQAQAAEYSEALTALQGEPGNEHAKNEVLRIAYNFSADVIPLIRLFISVCDLKPLVFWCTVKEQWALHRAFTALPWAALGRKERLEEYQSVVSQARSYAFHHVLPFDSTVEVDLSALDVRAEMIRIFVPYGQKHGRGIHLKDQRLADIFAQFSRAKERPVSEVFWKANLAVMQAACKLTEEVLATLILLHAAKREMA